MKRSTAVGLTIFLATVVTLGILFFTGPHMIEQAHVRSFQAVLPPTPEGAIPVADPVPRAPTTQEAAALRNPITASTETIARGRVYYEYYCRSCHGDAGDGRGPVGESFVPTPADLRTPRVRGLSDGGLLHAMLTGTGHEPILGRTVLPEHRWYLVTYVRSLTR